MQLTPLALALLFSALQVSAKVVSHSLTRQELALTLAFQHPKQCGSDKDCSASTICVKSSPNIAGTCQIACTLTSNERPCPLDSSCRSLPQVSTMQVGYCSEPHFCGGFAGVACPLDTSAVCVDDPRDDCDPVQGDADCGGVCVVQPILAAIPEGQTNQTFSGSTDKTCPPGYEWIPNGKDVCPFPCTGWCRKERSCDSRGLPACLEGETCVYDPSSPCAGAQDCPGVCRKTTAEVRLTSAYA